MGEARGGQLPTAAGTALDRPEMPRPRLLAPGQGRPHTQALLSACALGWGRWVPTAPEGPLCRKRRAPALAKGRSSGGQAWARLP